jgi:hypothetical protein
VKLAIMLSFYTITFLNNHASEYSYVICCTYRLANINILVGVILMSFFSKGKVLEVACYCDLALTQGAPRNGELNLTTPTDHQAETVANKRKDRNQARRERDRARRNNLTDEQKEEMNARRREAMQKKMIDERNAHQRWSRQNVSAKEREEMNAHRRERRKNIAPEERQTLQAQHNTRLEKK